MRTSVFGLQATFLFRNVEFRFPCEKMLSYLLNLVFVCANLLSVFCSFSQDLVMDVEGMVLSPFDHNIQFQCMGLFLFFAVVAMATGAWLPSSPSGARLRGTHSLTHSQKAF